MTVKIIMHLNEFFNYQQIKLNEGTRKKLFDAVIVYSEDWK